MILPSMLGSEEYYLGWIIQPLNPEGTLFYIYDRSDTSRPKGYTIRGYRLDAYRYIEELLGGK